jgi:pimeloyl-ACP methyl ester carboxylesterase
MAYPSRLPLGQRAIGFANGALGERANVRGGSPPAAMTVRVDHERVEPDPPSLRAAYPSASGRLVVFLHGLVETEQSWFHRGGTDFGARLAEDLGHSPVYVRYNSGRHISDTGRELVGLLSRVVRAWPVPVTEVVLIGHSMGGLVARSALHQANESEAPWLPKVTRLVCLGTPHTGAPLERGVARVAALLDRVPGGGPLGWLLSLRSDGIKDLARGYLHQRQWGSDGADAAPEAFDTVVPAGVRQHFIAVTLSRSEGSLYGRLFGDLLVTPASAGDPTQTAEVRWLGGLHHFDLLGHDTVYDTLLAWLRS